MIPYTELLTGELDIPETLVKQRNGPAYYNVPCAFDIETTSDVTHDGEKVAHMYIWMIGFGQGKPVYYGRTWEEFQDLLTLISFKLDLSSEKRLVLYVHNLGFEFQFIRKLFDWEEVFSVARQSPLKAVNTLGFEFRDSMKLSGSSLAHTARNLTKYRVEKAVGDLDYSKIRHSETPLTEKEMGYCKSDIDVLTSYIQEEIELNGNIIKIPMTNTGRVRSYTRDNCYWDFNEDGKKVRNTGKRNKYRFLMENLTLDVQTYAQLKRAFMGGFTHANPNYEGIKHSNVASYDFTSSYPTVMVSEKFPMTRFSSFVLESEEQLVKDSNRWAMCFDLTLYDVKPKISQDSYLSESKCHEKVNATIHNGRVRSADKITITCTEIDFLIIRECYEWGEMEVGNAIRALKNYLPKSIVKVVLDLYQKKTELKDVSGMETDYMISKGMLNSLYGMTVTDIVKDEHIYTNEWGVEHADPAAEISDYNTSLNRFTYYPWGVWITAYARLNLWSGIIETGDDYIYSDTDSLKLFNHEKHMDYFNGYNETIISKIERVCDHHNLDPQLIRPKTVEGVEKPLGVWDFEGVYTHFKTLGAKRYMTTERGKTKLTVAGLSKQNGIKYLEEVAEQKGIDLYDLFEDGMTIPPERTGKMTHTYIESEMEYQCVDYLGTPKRVEAASGLHLESCGFTMSLAPDHINFLKRLKRNEFLLGDMYK